eukprot:CAMPEP_0177475940 /NCGR_PEP_ID=MMETSP0369-20130122/23305_1 /TAXON_ID=447022 ORGANISM="Scrippsiella hangoei-like, Strain SHHI-4" /NCGR_SAMPLE_ID=MMETSP0369 /ASSEMBLY_ACC=CAM_ASM_000364 /LENGTH=189 /DNA_ID=CAMNT_0018951105 /DNA_START=152 /DNA_END=717 /DNA_ORIENTATION=-
MPHIPPPVHRQRRQHTRTGVLLQLLELLTDLRGAHEAAVVDEHWQRPLVLAAVPSGACSPAPGIRVRIRIRRLLHAAAAAAVVGPRRHPEACLDGSAHGGEADDGLRHHHQAAAASAAGGRGRASRGGSHRGRGRAARAGSETELLHKHLDAATAATVEDWGPSNFDSHLNDPTPRGSRCRLAATTAAA